MSATDRALLDMARALTAAYTAHTRPRAVMLVGSTALELTDTYSDIDLIAYYDVAPSPEQLDAARLADRLEALFDVCTDEAVKHAEQLVAETLEVVRTELPEADIGVLRHQPGERQAPWPIP